ncbi:MAG: lipoate--protein ligase family protein [Phycisphaerae bacterium]|nr:lipoate--protein ligase family protein [Phycisphaerae bacterium]
MDTCRLLIDQPLVGSVNMARDEALLHACQDITFEPVLRFYAWNPPTISLGYFQEIKEFEAIGGPAGELDVVRRTTGGGAILHDLEVTYSLILPIDHALVHGRPNQLYTLSHEAIIQAIGGGVARLFGCGQTGCGESPQRGPFFCFSRRHGLDVVLDDKKSESGASKIAGSAQRRTRQAILQHGSIMLDSRFAQQNVATWRMIDPDISHDSAVSRLVSAFGESLKMQLRLSAWRPEELENSKQYESIYSSEEWTRHRMRPK